MPALLWIGGGVLAFLFVKGQVADMLRLTKDDGSLNALGVLTWGGIALGAYYAVKRA